MSNHNQFIHDDDETSRIKPEHAQPTADYPSNLDWPSVIAAADSRYQLHGESTGVQSSVSSQLPYMASEYQQNIESSGRHPLPQTLPSQTIPVQVPGEYNLSPQACNGDLDEYQHNAISNDYSTSYLDDNKAITKLPECQSSIGDAIQNECVSHTTNAGGVASSQFSTLEGNTPIYNIPKELTRMRTGDSILETDSVIGHFGRTYHGYKEGKYLFPNDFVRISALSVRYYISY
jgi:hypothetical protein